MKLSLLTEWIDQDDGGKGEFLRDEIVEIAFALTNERSSEKLRNLLGQLKTYIEAVPTEKPKSEWQISIKHDLLDEITAASHSLDQSLITAVARDAFGLLSSLNIRNKPRD